MSLQPNPFRSATALRIHLPRSALVRLAVHDALGRRVRTLVEEIRPAGPSAAAWDGRNDSGSPVAGGVYFLQLHTEGRNVTDKVTRLK
jgi:flagellar hook assembly protein FlgD